MTDSEWRKARLIKALVDVAEAITVTSGGCDTQEIEAVGKANPELVQLVRSLANIWHSSGLGVKVTYE